MKDLKLVEKDTKTEIALVELRISISVVAFVAGTFLFVLSTKNDNFDLNIFIFLIETSLFMIFQNEQDKDLKVNCKFLLKKAHLFVDILLISMVKWLKHRLWKGSCKEGFWNWSPVLISINFVFKMIYSFKK